MSCGGSCYFASSMFRAICRQGVRQTRTFADSLARTHQTIHTSTILLKNGKQDNGRSRPQDNKRNTKPNPPRGPQRQGQQTRPNQQRRGNVPSPKNWSRPENPRGPPTTPEKKETPREQPREAPQAPRTREVSLPPMISVVNLARVLGVNMRMYIAYPRHASVPHGKNWSDGCSP